MAGTVINLDWTQQSSSPIWDGNYPNSERPSGGSGNPLYAPFPIQITEPQAGQTTANRYYKQYTGIEYNVKIGVRGGDFSELLYTLDVAPSGMTINPNTGEISWPNPVEAGSPHNITVSVSDGLTSDSVSWTLTVDTTNTLFVDFINGSSLGSGTIGDPLKDVPDWFLDDKNNDTYAGRHVYYRTGTYTPDSADKDARGSLTLSNADKPVVHMAYPGETVTFDMSLGFFFTDTQIHDVYVDGIDFINVGDFVSSGEGVWAWRLFGDRHVYRRGTWTGLNDIAGSNNQAYIMAVSSSARNEYWLISENSFDGNNANGYACGVFYRTDFSVIESNEISNCSLIGIGHKTENTTQSVRGNWATGTGKLYDGIGFTDGVGTGNAEYSWNYGDSPDAFALNDGLTGADDDFYYIRNTTTEAFYIREWDTESLGDVVFRHNVVVNAGLNLYTSELTVDPAKIEDTDNLINATETNFLSTVTGLLIDSFESQNATRGQNGLAGLK